MSMTNTANVATIKTAAVAPAPQHAGVHARGRTRCRFRVEILTVHIALILICGGFLLPPILMLSTMMIPFPVLMVSLFSIFRWVDDHTPIQILGTLKPLWIGSFFGNAFNIFLLRQFFRTIPEELSEAARIDGCSEIGIFCRV